MSEYGDYRGPTKPVGCVPTLLVILAVSWVVGRLGGLLGANPWLCGSLAFAAGCGAVAWRFVWRLR